jgi:hypothetical protein
MADQGYAPLKEIIKKVLLESGESGMHKYMLYKNYAIDFIRDFHSRSTGDIKTVKINMDHLKRIKLPDDCIEVVKVGVQMGDKVRVMLTDNEIALYYDKDSCGDKQPNASAQSNQSSDQLLYPFFFTNYVNSQNEHLGGFYGYGDGVVAQGYRINDRYIHFNSDVDTVNAYIEYLSNGFNPNEETLVNIVFTTPLKDFCKWKESADRKGPASADAMGWRSMFGSSLTKAVAKAKPITKQDILHASRTGYMLTTKS